MTTNYGLHRHSEPKDSALLLLSLAAGSCACAHGFALPASLAADTGPDGALCMRRLARQGRHSR